MDGRAAAASATCVARGTTDCSLVLDATESLRWLVGYLRRACSAAVLSFSVKVLYAMQSAVWKTQGPLAVSAGQLVICMDSKKEAAAICLYELDDANKNVPMFLVS